jgi:hypothetical protein
MHERTPLVRDLVEAFLRADEFEGDLGHVRILRALKAPRRPPQCTGSVFAHV